MIITSTLTQFKSLSITNILLRVALTVALLCTTHLLAMEGESFNNDNIGSLFKTRSAESLLKSITKVRKQAIRNIQVNLIPLVHEEVAQELKAFCGDNLCTIVGIDNINVLHKACLLGDVESVKIIIQAADSKADQLIFAPYAWGLTALHCAAMTMEHADKTIDVLLEWAQKNGKLCKLLSIQDIDGKTALSLTQECKYIVAEERLLYWIEMSSKEN